jgi:hypothetical protein
VCRKGSGIALELRLQDVCARPRAIRTNCNGRNAHTGMLSPHGDEWPVHEDLQLVVRAVEERGLRKEEQRFAPWIPSHCVTRTSDSVRII